MINLSILLILLSSLSLSVIYGSANDCGCPGCCPPPRLKCCDPTCPKCLGFPPPEKGSFCQEGCPLPQSLLPSSIPSFPPLLPFSSLPPSILAIDPFANCPNYCPCDACACCYTDTLFTTTTITNLLFDTTVTVVTSISRETRFTSTITFTTISIILTLTEQFFTTELLEIITTLSSSSTEFSVITSSITTIRPIPSQTITSSILPTFFSRTISFTDSASITIPSFITLDTVSYTNTISIFLDTTGFTISRSVTDTIISTSFFSSFSTSITIPATSTFFINEGPLYFPLLL